MVVPGRFASVTATLHRFVELTRKDDVDMRSSGAPDYEALQTLLRVN
jgi:hypothetical protein